MDAILTLAPTGLGPPRLHRFCFGLLPVSFPFPSFFSWGGGGRTLRPGTPGNLWGACVSRSSSFAPWSFGPLLQRRYPPSSLLWPLLTSPSLSRRSPPQVRCCFCPFIPSGSTSHVSDGHGASLWPASLPPVRGLSADSCSYGQRFVPRFLQLGRAACAPRLPPCGSLRLPPSVPVSTLQLTRNSPCWAHWRKPLGLPRTDFSVLGSASNSRCSVACRASRSVTSRPLRDQWRRYAVESEIYASLAKAIGADYREKEIEQLWYDELKLFPYGGLYTSDEDMADALQARERSLRLSRHRPSRRPELHGRQFVDRRQRG